MRPLSLRPSNILRSLDPALKDAKTDYDAHCTVGVVIAFAFVRRTLVLCMGLQLAEDSKNAQPGVPCAIFEVPRENLKTNLKR